MKKGYQDHFYHGRSVRLYRDDIEEIITVVTKYCKEVVIASYEYEYESLDELESKRGTDLKQIEVKGTSPYVFFHVGRGIGGRSWVGGNGEGSETPYLLISNLLAERKRTVLRLFLHPNATILYLGILTLVLFFFAPGFKTHALLASIISALYGVFALLILWLSYTTVLGNYSYITLRRRHEKSTFWRRNKDTVLVGVIVAILTAFVTWLVTYLTSK